jgi:hypothetical protein
VCEGAVTESSPCVDGTVVVPEQEELVSEGGAEPGTKQAAVQRTGVIPGTGGTGKKQLGRGLPGVSGPGSRRARTHRACGREASGTPRYRLCSDGLDRPLRAWFAKPKWRSRTEIPPSPGKRMYQVPPVSRLAGTSTGTGLVAGGEDEASGPRVLGKLLRGGRLQHARGRRNQEKHGQLLARSHRPNRNRKRPQGRTAGNVFGFVQPGKARKARKAPEVRVGRGLQRGG